MALPYTLAAKFLLLVLQHITRLTYSQHSQPCSHSLPELTFGTRVIDPAKTLHLPWPLLIKAVPLFLPGRATGCLTIIVIFSARLPCNCMLPWSLGSAFTTALSGRRPLSVAVMVSFQGETLSGIRLPSSSLPRPINLTVLLQSVFIISVSAPRIVPMHGLCSFTSH